MRWVVVAVALLATACGAFTDDPFSDTPVQEVALSPEGRRLRFFIGTCDEYKLQVDEDDERVRLTARGEDDPGAGCVGYYVVVELGRPLLDREVIDTYDGEPVDLVDCGERPNARRCAEFRAEG